MADKTAILADIHGNSPALRAVLEHVRNERCDELFVLGDIINGVDPKGCLDLLLAQPAATCIKGNAELYLLTPDLDAFSRKAESFYPNLIQLLKGWLRRIPESYLDELRRMPDHLQLGSSLFVHDSPVDRFCPEKRWVEGVDEKYQELCFHGDGIRESIACEELSDILAVMDSREASRLFCGHTHEAFIKPIGQKLICNVGSVGMPLDGDPRASWVVVEGGPRDGDIRVTRTEYDVEETIRMLDAHDGSLYVGRRYGDAYKTMLRTGVHWKVWASK